MTPNPPSEDALLRMRQAALEELARTPRARAWWKDALLLAGLNAAVTAACTVGLAMKGNAWDRAAPALLWTTAVPLALTVLLGAVAAAMPQRPSRMLWPLALAARTGAAVIFLGAGGTADGFLRTGMPCMRSEWLISLVPIAGAVVVLTKFAHRPLRTFVAALSAGATGLFALHVHCRIGSAAHLAAFHVAPWLIAAGVAVWARARMKTKSYAP